MLGQLVDTGESHVHLYCIGDGSPTVVVAAGGFSFDWGLVQPQVARFTRICTYDPTGTTWSDPLPDNKTPNCSDRVRELHAVLDKAGERGPYVLVGFSIGGLIARLYAARFPADVSGVVFVDHAFIDTGTDKLAEESPGMKAAGIDTPPVAIYQPPIELDMADDQNFGKLPDRDQQLHRWALSIGSFRPSAEMAKACFSEVGKEEKTPYPLGDKSVAVISTLYDSPKYRELQSTLLKLSHHSLQYMAENSTHMVIIDQPEIVIDAIKNTVDTLRKVSTRSR